MSIAYRQLFYFSAKQWTRKYAIQKWYMLYRKCLANENTSLMSTILLQITNRIFKIIVSFHKLFMSNEEPLLDCVYMYRFYVPYFVRFWSKMVHIYKEKEEENIQTSPVHCDFGQRKWEKIFKHDIWSSMPLSLWSSIWSVQQMMQ